jgi:hypothetical protein
VGAHSIDAVAKQQPANPVGMLGRNSVRDDPLVQVNDPAGRSEPAIGVAVVSWHHERDHGFADARNLKS